MNVGRLSSFDKEQALDSAMDSFWARGFDACSTTDLVDSTGLSRGSLYGYFGDKRSLFESCLIQYRIRTKKWLLDNLHNSESTKDFIEKSLRRVVLEAKENSPRACFAIHTVSEFGQLDPEIATIVRESLDQFMEVFRVGLIRGQVSGEILDETPAEELAEYILTNMAGLRTMVNSGMQKQSIENTITIILRSIR